MQAPTIGRRVWLWVPTVGFGTVLHSKQAFDAGVNFVNDEGGITVTYFDHEGHMFTAKNVPLYDPKPTDMHTGGGDPYATWMPYQKLQHEKDTFVAPTTPAN